MHAMNPSSSNAATKDTTALFVHKMEQAGMSREVIDLFADYLTQLSNSRSVGYIPESMIAPVPEGEIAVQEDLTEKDTQTGASVLDQAVIIKLNGGLGTSMGMPYAKSLLTVKSGLTFLDVIVNQAVHGPGSGGQGVSLVLMDSFKTHADTEDYVQRAGWPESERPLSFVQHRYPKVLADDLRPAECPEHPELEWNPPGHGDLFSAIYTTGMLQKLLDQGKRYAFISNADNLGAVLSPSILGYFVRQGLHFLMEVAERTPADKKGGHLAKREDGRLLLREIAQCPEQDMDSFQDVSRYRYFNTNSIWLDLQALQSMIESQGLPRLPLIVNPKHLDPRDESSPQVYQLETAMGAAISAFDKSGALHVHRRRFAPVKKTNDLLAVRSDCFVLNDAYQLVPNPSRRLPPVEVELDSEYFKKVDQFESRFPQGEPSLVDCEQLTVTGDVVFEGDVVCKGQVFVRNETNRQQRIARGSVLNGETVWTP